MIDKDAPNNDQAEAPAKPRWPLILAAAVVIICLILLTAIGSILVNVEWPTDLGDWLKPLLGGLLILIGTVGVTYAPSEIKGIIKDRGGAKSDHEDSYRYIERLSQISPRRAIISIVFAGIVITAATLVPRIPVPSPPPVEPGVITLMSAIDDSDEDARYTLIKQWNSANPENRVELITVSGEPDSQHQGMVNEARGARRADVYVLDIVWMPEFIQRGYIEQIDESRLVDYRGDDFLDKAMETCLDTKNHKPGLWALPFNSDAGLMYYRPTLGVSAPESWDDYFGIPAKDELARVSDIPAVRETVTNLVAANAPQLISEEILTVTALEAIWAEGGELTDRDGNLPTNPEGEVVVDQAAVDALKNLATAVSDDKIVHPDSHEADEAGSRKTFADGETLFHRNWPVEFDGVVADSNAELLFDVTTLPHDSVLGGQNLAIARDTDKPRAVQELIQFLTSPESQLILFEVGGFAPTRPSAFTHSRRPYAQDLRTAIENA
jgi:multiple sugar transport system substrate-binding protein